MLIGIVASQDFSDVATAGTVLDFVNGRYTVDGVSLTAADVVDDTGRISGSGLSIIGSSPVGFLGAFAAQVATAQWTITIDFNVSYSGPQRVTFLETGDVTLGTIIQLLSFAGFVEAYDDNGLGATRDLNTANSFSASVDSQISYTRTDASASLSLNGGAADTSSTSVVGINVEEVHGADSFHAGLVGYIQRIELSQHGTPADASLTLSAGTGSFMLTGTAASIHGARSLSAGAGAFALTGTDATLTKSGAFALSAGAGSFALTGTSASLLHARTEVAGAGSFALTGSDATPTIGHRLAAGSGNYALTGTTATPLHGWTEIAGAGSFALTGTSATLTKSAAAPLDGVSGVTGAWSMSRALLTSFGAGSKFTNVSGAVSSFNDQSGNSRHLSNGTAGARPAISTAGPNTLACASFDGTDDVLTGTAFSNFISVSAGYMLWSFIIHTIAANSGNPYENDPVCGDAGGFLGLYIRNTAGTPETAQAYNFSGGNQSAEAAVITGGTAYVVEWWHDAGSVFLCVNNGTPVSVSSGNTGNISGAIGLGRAYTGSSNFSDLDVFEGFCASAVPASRATVAADFMTASGAV